MIRRALHIGATRKLAVILAALVLLPALFYSTYEISTLTRSEQLLGDIYRQQLDAILFSVNQYAWDVVNSWMNTAALGSPRNTRQEKDLLRVFLRNSPAIDILFLSDSSASSVTAYGRGDTALSETERKGIVQALRRERGLLQRLYKFEASGYRKVESISLTGSAGDSSLILLAVGDSHGETAPIIGILIHPEQFVREILRKKLSEAAGENFVLAILKKSSGALLYSTGAATTAEMRQANDLWIFPDYAIAIRLKGETIEEVVRDRFYRNLLLIGLLDAVLMLGVWFVYRTVRREVELAQMKSDFVSNVSHELKTPLALIRMFGETLQMNRATSDGKKAEYYDTIVRESERLTRLVNNILNFSRMEAGRKEYRFAPTSLSDLAAGVVKTYHAHLAQEGFTVTTDLHTDLPSISADAESVSEALLNIIDNAVKYSPQQKWIRIATGRAEGTVFLEVEDHGIGIEPVHQKRIFEKFYRASGTLVHTTKGSGLGLTLVRHIMDAHGGTVTVTSTPGSGSTFRLSFPITLIH